MIHQAGVLIYVSSNSPCGTEQSQQVNGAIHCRQGLHGFFVKEALQLEDFLCVEQAAVYEFVKIGDERRAHHIDGLLRIGRGEGGVLELPLNAKEKANIV